MDDDVEVRQGAGPWWREAVVYEVYPRSFADSNGDGEGDLRGLISRLPYLVGLGVDALWIAPWYPSPMADGGYDVTDYRSVHPMFGTLEEAERLLSEAHRQGLRVIIDLVANHTSVEHPWFREAVNAPAGSPARRRYFFRDGRGSTGQLPPNNWISAFGDSAWTRTRNQDGSPGQWYLHTFGSAQPDLDWSNPQVHTEFDDVLRFWLDRGVDGFRVDAAPAMAKVAGLPDADYSQFPGFASGDWVDNPHWDVDEVHDIFRRWRALADARGGQTLFVAEAVVRNVERLSHYVRSDEFQAAFNFTYLRTPWSPRLREVIDETLTSLAQVGATPTWALGSHDETRLATRLGRAQTGAVHLVDPSHAESDPLLGQRRARAATMLMLALPGSAYIYQGDELGLPSVSDIPNHERQDPVYFRSGGAIPGRDGCRVPLPWSGDGPPFGFGPTGSRPWLTQPDGWRELTVDAQEADPSSMLRLVRDALQRRRTLWAAAEPLVWADSDPAVLDFRRGDSRCLVNLSPASVAVDDTWRAQLASAPIPGGLVPPDTCVWLSRRAPQTPTTDPSSPEPTPSTRTTPTER